MKYNQRRQAPSRQGNYSFWDQIEFILYKLAVQSQNMWNLITEWVITVNVKLSKAT